MNLKETIKLFENVSPTTFDDFFLGKLDHIRIVNCGSEMDFVRKKNWVFGLLNVYSIIVEPRYTDTQRHSQVWQLYERTP